VSWWLGPSTRSLAEASERQWTTAGPVSPALSRLRPAWNRTAWHPPVHSDSAAAWLRLAAQERSAPASSGCPPSAGHACSSARAAARAAWSRIGWGVADLAAACTTGCTRTVRAALAGSMVSRPVRSRLRRAPPLRLASGASPLLSPPMNSQAAGVLNRSPGIPWQSSSTASARHGWASLPGRSWSACSTDSVHVTALAEGSPPSAWAI